jgi:chlorite dismutase
MNIPLSPFYILPSHNQTEKIQTSYSFGIDDQEFVVAFETDYPQDFVDLVMDLRETQGSLYVERDTPIFSCIANSLEDTVNSLGI